MGWDGTGWAGCCHCLAAGPCIAQCGLLHALAVCLACLLPAHTPPRCAACASPALLPGALPPPTLPLPMASKRLRARHVVARLLSRSSRFIHLDLSFAPHMSVGHTILAGADVCVPCPTHAQPRLRARVCVPRCPSARRRRSSPIGSGTGGVGHGLPCLTMRMLLSRPATALPNYRPAQRGRREAR